jgi:hypothetical protein
VTCLSCLTYISSDPSPFHCHILDALHNGDIHGDLKLDGPLAELNVVGDDVAAEVAAEHDLEPCHSLVYSLTTLNSGQRYSPAWIRLSPPLTWVVQPNHSSNPLSSLSMQHSVPDDDVGDAAYCH